MSEPRSSLSAIEMNVTEYLANPREATRKAEQAGYVLVGGST